jgi:hypothetical protein
MMNWKGYERKWSWSNLWYYHGICLEGLRKTTKTVSQNSRSPCRDLNWGPSEYEEVLSIQTQRSVLCLNCIEMLITIIFPATFTH